MADMVILPTKTSSLVKKLQICISFVSNLRKQCLYYLLFYKWWKPPFSNFQEGFSLISPKLQGLCAQNFTHEAF